MRGGIGSYLHATPDGPGEVRNVQRDIFPLPFVNEDEGIRKTLSRGCQQRLQRRREEQREVNRCVGSLNQLFDHRYPGNNAQQRKGQMLPNLAQEKCLEFIEDCISEIGPSGEISGSEALDALRISCGYEALPTSSALGSFNPEKVSLPAGEVRPVELACAWGSNGQSVVEEFIHEQVLSRDDAMSRLTAAGVERCYSDPALRQLKNYVPFVRRLHGLGLVDFSLEEAVEQVEIFFVKKKQDKLRMILDCRRSNCHFGVPSNVRLATGDSLARVEMAEGEKLYICNADLANAFYTLAMPAELRKFFGLRRIKAKDLGLTEVQGQPVDGSTWVTPRISVLPMGWSWALYWCQSIHEKIVERSGLLPAERLQDFSPAPDKGFFHIQYVDNLHVGGTCREEVVRRFRQAVAELEATGLTVHEVEECESETKVLGWEYESRGLFRPGRGRVWRARKAIREIVRRGRASGQQLERLVGHMTFISLGRREVLSVFAEIYTFIRKHYAVETPLWKSVRRELQIWDGICPLIVQNLQTPWSEKILSVDASEWGLGVCEADTSSTSNRELGSFSERWRFRDSKSSLARNFTFMEDEKIRGAIDLDGAFEEEEVEGVDHFSSVGYNIVDRPWTVVGRYQRRKQESMPVLEARSTLHAVKHILRSSGRHRQRHVVLTDSMTAALAFSKGRAKTQLLRNVVQRVSALCLSTGSTVFLRWIPSEWNPSDSPSRGGYGASVLTRVPTDVVSGSQDTRSKRRELESIQEEFGKSEEPPAGPCEEACRNRQEEKEVQQSERPNDGATSDGRQFPTGLIGGTSHVGELSSTLARVHGMVQKEEKERQQGDGPRQCPGAVLRRGLCSRRGFGHWQLCEGECSLPSARAEGEIGPSKSPASPQGLEEIEPTQESDACPVRGSGFASCGGEAKPSSRDRPGAATEFYAISETGGIHQDPGLRCGKTGPPWWPSISTLGVRSTSSRSGSALKDGTVGRGTHLGPALPELLGKGHRSNTQVEKQGAGGAGFHGEHQAGERLHAPAVAKAPVGVPQAPASISVAARRGIFRTGGQAQAHHRSTDSWKMGDRSVAQELRKGVEVEPVVRQFDRGKNSKNVFKPQNS